MAIAFDAQSNSTTTGYTNFGTSPKTLSHTVTGSNTALLVWVFADDGDRVTGVTYNGVSMTLIRKRARYDANQQMYLYALANPSTGANNISVSFTSTITNGMIAGVSYTGVHQTTPVEAYADDSQSSANASVSVTTLTDNAWIVGMLQAGGSTISAGSGTTLRGGATNSAISSDSNGAKTPTGSYSQAYSHSSNDWTCIVASLKPASGSQNLTLTAGTGAFTLTGNSANIGYLYTLIAGTGAFILTGIDTILRFAGWSNQTKNTSSWNNQDKVSTVIDSYGKSNTNATYSLYNGYSVIFMGQSFSNTNVGYLDNIKFHIFKSGSPAGNATAYLYAHTGTLGSSSLAIGSPLATSSTLIDVSTLGTTTAQELSTFYFTGYGRVRMEASTNYCIVLGYNGGDASNYLKIGTDTTSPTPVGNIMYSANGTSWTAITANDLIYSVSSFQSPTFSNVTKNSSTFTNQLKN